MLVLFREVGEAVDEGNFLSGYLSQSWSPLPPPFDISSFPSGNDVKADVGGSSRRKNFWGLHENTVIRRLLSFSPHRVRNHLISHAVSHQNNRRRATAKCNTRRDSPKPEALWRRCQSRDNPLSSTRSKFRAFRCATRGEAAFRWTHLVACQMLSRSLILSIGSVCSAGGRIAPIASQGSRGSNHCKGDIPTSVRQH